MFSRFTGSSSFDAPPVLSVRSFLPFFVCAGLALGCGKDDAATAPAVAASEGKLDCAKAVARRTECLPELKVDGGAEQVALCESIAASDPMKAKAQFGSCLEEPSCAEYAKCAMALAAEQAKFSQAAKATRRLAELHRLVAEKKWSDAGTICRVYADATVESPDFKAACDAVAAAAVKAISDELAAIRDKLLPEDTVLKCVDLLAVAKKVSPEALAAAEVLCAELKVVRRVTEARAAVEKARKELSAQVPFQCEWALRDLDGIESPWAKSTRTAVAKECNEDLPKELISAAEKGLAAMRDSGDTKDGFSRCFEFKRLAKTLSADAAARAEALCDEVDLASDVKKALDEAADATEKQAEELPFACDYTIERLEKLGTSEWAKGRVETLARACYIDVGKSILAKKVPGMKFGCDYHVQKVFDGVTRFKLADPAIDGLVLQARTQCQRTPE
jgi:hypothetical protein